MNVIKAAASGLKTLFGFDTGKGAENVMEVARGVGTWIDERQFTEEEKAKYNAQLVESYAGYLQLTVDENTERSRSRRAIALWVIRTEIFTLAFSAFTYPFDEGWAAYTYKIASDSPLGLLTLGIGAFFFGTHLIRAAR